MVSTPLKNISQNGNLPQIGVKINNIWNHHLGNIIFQKGHEVKTFPIDGFLNLLILLSMSRISNHILSTPEDPIKLTGLHTGYGRRSIDFVLHFLLTSGKIHCSKSVSSSCIDIFYCLRLQKNNYQHIITSLSSHSPACWDSNRLQELQWAVFTLRGHGVIKPRSDQTYTTT